MLNPLFQPLIDNLSKWEKDLETIFKPGPKSFSLNPKSKSLNPAFDLSYAGAELLDPYEIQDPNRIIIGSPSKVLNLSSAFTEPGLVIIRDYTRKPRQRTKNLFNPETGRFSMIHIPNLITKFLEDNEHIFNCRDQEVDEVLDRKKFGRTSKDVYDRFADMFGDRDLVGISEDNPFEVLTLDLRKRLWESWRTGNNQIEDIYRIVRHYEGFGLILPESSSFKEESIKAHADIYIPEQRDSLIDSDGFNWETGQLENINPLTRKELIS